MKKYFLLVLLAAFVFQACDSVNKTSQNSSTEVNENPSPQQIEQANALYQEASALYEAKKYAAAGDRFASSFALNPGTYSAFNGACSYSLAGNKEKGIEWCQKAYEQGWLGFAEDKDLDILRGEPAFKKLLATANAELKALNADANPVVTFFPKNQSSPKTMIIAAHGYGGNPENYSKVYQPLAEEKGAMIVSIRASTPDARTAFHWNLDAPEYARLRTIVLGLQSKHGVAPERTILTGFSQGGMICFSFGLENADLFAGIIPVAGRPMEPAMKISDNATGNFKVYALLGDKEQDKYHQGAKKAKAFFDANDIQYQWIAHPGGHSFPENRNQVLREAYEYILE